LSQLSEETVILTTKEEKINIVQELIDQYNAKHIAEHEVEVTISQNHSLNHLFEIINQNKIELSSFRNKTNRLEALFMKITK
jgi:ABC-type multidrug transport system ATPase subunit